MQLFSCELFNDEHRIAPRAVNDEALYEDGLDEDIYVSNVYALRESLARQHRNFRHERPVVPIPPGVDPGASSTVSAEDSSVPVDKERLAHLEKVFICVVFNSFWGLNYFYLLTYFQSSVLVRFLSHMRHYET